ncbi:hypothetical protein A0257_22880 (plasmid) [Hymenobacter psoromatis]|nr:hypothetical protein A0257_22880 [Hymenobacter psoromatis]
MEKKIKKIASLHLAEQTPGFTSTGVMNAEYNTEPYLVFGEFYMDRSVFGPHAHAGVSVMTYVLPDSKGSFLNRDSLGDHTIIGPGGVQVTQTGSGIYHDELPEIPGTNCHAFQIWINHGAKDRLVEPKALHLPAKEVPEFKTEQVLLRVIQGNYQDLQSPLKLVTETLLFDVAMQPNAVLELAAMEMTFIYLISGRIVINGKEIAGRSLVKFADEGESIVVTTSGDNANFMFASGTPHHEPIIYGGPFVMTTQQQMQETRQRQQRGEMGFLLPV